jgi:4,5-DOPA dioxygenase extradiol
MVEPNPTLYLSHGAPDILLRETSAKQFLTELGSHLQDPTGIVVVSAHWIDDPVGITVGDRLNTIHDFGGFPNSLYEMSYPAMGSDSLSAEIGLLLSEAKIESRPVKGRGLDHGVWIPLRLIYPEAQIPVIQVALPAVTLKELVSFGEALAPLRERGVLIIGSGGSVHNLRAMNRENRSDSWAVEFEAWLKESVEQNHFARLISSDQYPRNFQQAHPTIEHFAPLIVAWSAAGSSQPGVRIHHSFDYGNIGMSMFAFGGYREI